jgi:hypothetical protein
MTLAGFAGFTMTAKSVAKATPTAASKSKSVALTVRIRIVTPCYKIEEWAMLLKLA